MKLIQRRSRYPLVLLASLAVGLASTCSSGANEGSYPPEARIDYFLEFSDYETQVQWSRNRHIAVQELTAECMRSQGFEYALVPFDEQSVFRRPVTRTEIAEFGFGYTPNFDDDEVRSVPVDPNEAILQKLDQTTASAWIRTAYGDESNQGCLLTAGAAVSDPWVQPRELISEALDEMNERISADLRTLDLDYQWSQCMSRWGHSVQSPLVIFNYLEKELRRFRLEESSDEPTLQAARELEIEIALASYDCKEPLEISYDAIRAEYEASFVDENIEQLALIRAEIQRVEP